jgi:GntR family transcriptional regulator
LGLDEFGDLLYPLYEKACKQVVATAIESLEVEQAGQGIASL